MAELDLTAVGQPPNRVRRPVLVVQQVDVIRNVQVMGGKVRLQLAATGAGEIAHQLPRIGRETLRPELRVERDREEDAVQENNRRERPP